MADSSRNGFNSEEVNTENVLSELEALSKKYGLDFDSSKFSTSNPSRTPDITKNHTPPKNNNPARTSRIVYDSTNPSGGVKVVYSEYQSTPQGPQGRRVVYQEQEGETIAEKRRRNAAMQAARTAQQQKSVTPVSQEPKNVEEQPKVQPVKEETPPAPETTSDAELDILISDDSFFKIEQEETPPEKEKRVHKHYETSSKDKIIKFFKSFVPWKGDKTKEIFRKIAMDISAIVVVVCIGIFINSYIEHRNQLQKQQELEQLKNTETVTDDTDAQWDAIKAKYPDVEFPEGMKLEFAEIYAQNQDFVGWLTVENTNIDTAIVHRPSDINSNSEDYYLHKNFFGSYDKYGNPYLDKYNTGSSLDKNNIIYGHNMTDGLSFAQLEKYYTIEGFQDSPIIEYSTLYKTYYFKVYAVIITNGYSSGDNGYLFSYITAHFASDANFESFIEALDERKLYDTGVDINKDDKLITLSTCSYEIKQNQMGRLAVIGRLVRDGESLDVDTSLATENENVRYPQIWYDEHNMTNPYKNAYRWKAE